MECKEEGKNHKKCGGIIDMKSPHRIQTGCESECKKSTSIAYPCSTCGRLYHENGNPVFTSGREKAFLPKS